jgi:serine/threonine-protein kinase
MAEKPHVTQGGKKPPPKAAATMQPKKPLKKVAPEMQKPAPSAKIQGKTVRKDIPLNGATSPLGQETLDTEMLEQDAPARAEESAEVDGKVIRKNRPMNGATSSVGQETIATDPPEHDAPQPAPKASQATEKPGAEKAASMIGDYKLLKKLGQGGMGAVYKAQWVSKNQVVALKVLAKELAGKGTFVQRFEREARAMQKLDHPNILRCFDVGHDKAKGFHYLSMEIVDGGSVEGWLKKLGRFSVGDALHIILKTCEAMQHAHDKTIIHRDIKPDNILLTSDGVVKVADLGLAKDTDEDVSLTKTGAGAGTPIYMAPEQARDVKHVDVRVDIYAIGVMMYVFLTGRAPFEGGTLVELISAKEKGKFDPMRRHNDEVPPKLDLIVDKMIAKDAKMRYASCQEVIDQLTPLGLANEELSFLATDKEATIPNKRAAKPAPTNVPQKPAAKPTTKTTAPVNRPVSAKTNIEEEESERDVWYWNMVTPEGKIITKKLSTEQIKALIKAGRIEPAGEISKTIKGGFRPAGTFVEFQGAFKTLEAATKANTKGTKYKNKMQQFQDDYDRQKRWAGLSRMFKGVGGTIFGLLWILLILGGIAIGGWFLWTKVMN